MPVLLNTAERLTGTEAPPVIAAVTVRLAVAGCNSEPEAPVTVREYLPAEVAAVVEMVRVDEPAEVMEGGLKLAVAPAGTPLAASVTVPAKPLRAVTVAVNVALLPAVTLCDAGATVKPKSVEAETARLTFALCCRVPDVPITTSG
jgi:hypothetical protein